MRLKRTYTCTFYIYTPSLSSENYVYCLKSFCNRSSMVEYVQREAKWRVINDGTKKIVIECAERPKFNQFGLDIKKVTREEAALAFPSIHNWP